MLRSWCGLRAHCQCPSLRFSIPNSKEVLSTTWRGVPFLYVKMTRLQMDTRSLYSEQKLRKKTSHSPRLDDADSQIFSIQLKYNQVWELTILRPYARELNSSLRHLTWWYWSSLHAKCVVNREVYWDISIYNHHRLGGVSFVLKTPFLACHTFELEAVLLW